MQAICGLIVSAIFRKIQPENYNLTENIQNVHQEKRNKRN